MGLKEELDARAKFKVGQFVLGPGFASMRVIARYWRRSEDAFYYDLEDLPAKGTKPKKLRMVPEHRVHKPRQPGE